MTESDLKQEVKQSTINLYPEVVWCNHSDRVNKGIADTELVYRGMSYWIEWKSWIKHPNTRSIIGEQSYQVKSMQLRFLELRINAGIRAYIGIFKTRNLLEIHHVGRFNGVISSLAFQIKRENKIWDIKPIFASSSLSVPLKQKPYREIKLNPSDLMLR